MTRLKTLFAAAFAALSLALAGAALAVDNGGPIDQAMAAGRVGEQADGYLGFVRPPTPADAELQRAVNEVNIRRRAVYTEIAQKNNQPVEVVATLTFERQVERMPAGRWFRDGSGQWRQKPAAP